MNTLSLVAYHDIIDTADDVKKKFAELDRDTYPDEVYQYILDYHLETQTPVVDVLAWCCDIRYAQIGTDEYDYLSDDDYTICRDDDGVWYV